MTNARGALVVDGFPCLRWVAVARVEAATGRSFRHRVPCNKWGCNGCGSRRLSMMVEHLRDVTDERVWVARVEEWDSTVAARIRQQRHRLGAQTMTLRMEGGARLIVASGELGGRKGPAGQWMSRLVALATVTMQTPTGLRWSPGWQPPPASSSVKFLTAGIGNEELLEAAHADAAAEMQSRFGVNWRENIELPEDAHPGRHVLASVACIKWRKKIQVRKALDVTVGGEVLKDPSPRTVTSKVVRA